MTNQPGYWKSLHGVATLILIGVALYLLFVEHANHILPYLPFLIILLCPLMHLFMHKGHGGHEQHEHPNQNVKEAYRQGLEEGRKEVDKNR